ncbi:hypothetical protein MM326_07560 [Alkalihalobacillus sp. LMS6]|uniref:hypothetical protein n=1 Tax=Alkalihalobacillus sp. LMS6 TaxID=2924034 RepID=UPI0020D17C98|nr:hypothetical protein [Alkalihalobacillus sp. LMS6]UTR07862.1 hypothetical protein MM326_07560 [Alkalihalobacillus sp. LMS6]
MMSAIVIQRCIEVTQEIAILEKRVVESSFELALYSDRIETSTDHFPLDSVFDISFRFPSDTPHSLGFLYLHTSKGVTTYKIKTSPETFIKEFKKLVPETKYHL